MTKYKAINITQKVSVTHQCNLKMGGTHFWKKNFSVYCVDFAIKKKSTQSKIQKIILEAPSLKAVIYATSKVTKFGVFSGPYFSAFIPNTWKHGPDKTHFRQC